MLDGAGEPEDRRADQGDGVEPEDARRLRGAQDRRLLLELHGRGARSRRRGSRRSGPALDRIAAISDRRALARELGGTLRADVDIFNNTNLHTGNLFGLWVAQDLDDPRQYSPFLVQGGLGMPDREYYLDPSPRMTDIRAKYQAHIAAVLKLARCADAEAKARADLRPRAPHRAGRTGAATESQDVIKGNNHWTRQDLDKSAPGLDWAAFLTAAGLAGSARLRGLAAERGDGNLGARRPTSRSRPGRTTSPSAPRRGRRLSAEAAFVDESFAFYGKVLTGHAEAARPLEARRRLHQRRAGRGGRQALRPRGIFRPRRRRGPKRWCATSSRPSASASTGSTGCPRRRRPARRRSWPR